MEELIPIFGIMFVFGIPLSAIWTSHFRKMAEIRAQMGDTVNGTVVSEITALRQEVAALRETTTRFDMSFDAALSRVEQRLDSVENNQANSAPAWQPPVTDKGVEVVLRAGAGR